MTRRSFVVRIWLDEEGAISGQISDPLTDWRHPFQNSTQLWALMKSFLVELPPAESSPTKSRKSLPENSASSEKGDSDPM
ncbi:MAG TPA: hypothetical protein ENK32_07360 [Anaerolineae bacterium]|nr:hypothetical protein [Anaerolineae bacterium]